MARPPDRQDRPAKHHSHLPQPEHWQTQTSFCVVRENMFRNKIRSWLSKRLSVALGPNLTGLQF